MLPTNNTIRNVSLNQKKILITTVIFILVISLLWGFVCFPRKEQLNNLKSEFNGLQKEIEQIESVFIKDQNLVEGIRAFKDRFKQMENKFPEKEEEGLKMISDLARDYNIEITLTQSQPKQEFFNEEGDEIIIEDKTCMLVPVSVDLNGSYQDLLSYIDSLNDRMPSLVTVEVLNINRDRSSTRFLNVKLNLNLYLLS